MKLKSLLVAASLAISATIMAPQVSAEETTPTTATTAPAETTSEKPSATTSTTPAETTTTETEVPSSGSSGLDKLMVWNQEMAPLGRDIAAVVDIITLVISVLSMFAALAKLPGVGDAVKQALRNAGVRI